MPFRLFNPNQQSRTSPMEFMQSTYTPNPQAFQTSNLLNWNGSAAPVDTGGLSFQAAAPSFDFGLDTSSLGGSDFAKGGFSVAPSEAGGFLSGMQGKDWLGLGLGAGQTFLGWQGHKDSMKAASAANQVNRDALEFKKQQYRDRLAAAAS